MAARGGETLSHVSAVGPVGPRCALRSGVTSACTQGGAGPGLVTRRRRVKLLLVTPTLLGLSVVGAACLWARQLVVVAVGLVSAAAVAAGSSGAVAPSDPALFGAA